MAKGFINSFDSFSVETLCFHTFLLRRCFDIAKQELMINEEIKDAEVRLIGPDGEQLGVVSGKEAQRIAAEHNLDLVKIAPQAKPPVCKVIDYGKYKFELAKRDKEAKKKQKVIDIKEVRLSPNIDEHDFMTKINQGIKFLKNGDKVKVSVRFRGREITHSSIGKDLLNRVKEEMAEFGAVDKDIKLEGRNMAMFITPKKN
ncbi:MAG: translation initiation factor IF-3 [Clostridia bacterium]|nr:translation initiation factor IF-3 [Clostridia bacterium]